jgi:integrase/recombinase XerD
MALGKQAKILSSKQVKSVLTFLNSTRDPVRNKVIFFLSIKAGLRAKEIASLTWDMITDSEGSLSDNIALQDSATKGKSGRNIPLNRELKTHLLNLQMSRTQSARVVQSQRSKEVSSQTIVNMLASWYGALGMSGCSSHSGRRTFITNAAKKVSEVGGSLRDVQQLAGHTSLTMTQRYIEADSAVQRKLIDLI